MHVSLKAKGINLAKYFLLTLFFDSFLIIPIVMIWRRQWHPTPGLLHGKSHGWRSLVGHSPWGREEWDMTE